MSLFDICVVAVCCVGLIFQLGVYAGRAAAWREGCWYVLGVDPNTVGPPPKLGKPTEPEGMPAPPAYRTEVHVPVEHTIAKPPSGQPTRVVGRRQLPPPSNGRPGK